MVRIAMTSKGFSLVETMIAMGILGVTAVGFMQTMGHQNAMLANESTRLDEREIVSSIKSVLSDSNSCALTFVGYCSVATDENSKAACTRNGGTWTSNSISAVLNGGPTRIFQHDGTTVRTAVYQSNAGTCGAGVCYGRFRDIRIRSMRFTKNAAANATGAVIMAVTLDKVNGGTIVSTTTFPITMQLTTDAANLITGCFAEWSNTVGTVADKAAELICNNGGGSYNKNTQTCTFAAYPSNSGTTIASTDFVARNYVELDGTNAVSGDVTIGGASPITLTPNYMGSGIGAVTLNGNISITSGDIISKYPYGNGNVYANNTITNGVIRADSGLLVGGNKVTVDSAGSMTATGKLSANVANAKAVTLGGLAVASQKFSDDLMFQNLTPNQQEQILYTMWSVTPTAYQSGVDTFAKYAMNNNINCPGGPGAFPYVKSITYNSGTGKADCAYGDINAFLANQHCTKITQHIYGFKADGTLDCQPELLYGDNHTVDDCPFVGGTVIYDNYLPSATNRKLCRIDKFVNPWNYITGWDAIKWNCPSGWSLRANYTLDVTYYTEDHGAMDCGCGQGSDTVTGGYNLGTTINCGSVAKRRTKDAACWGDCHKWDYTTGCTDVKYIYCY